MTFDFKLLLLVLLASPLIVLAVVYWIVSQLGSRIEPSQTPAASPPPRKTYFYPTRELDGN